MKVNTAADLLSNSAKEQKILMNDERFIEINEKTSHTVSKIMNWLLFALLFITGAIMKNYAALFIISSIIIVKFILTLACSYYYNKTL